MLNSALAQTYELAKFISISMFPQTTPEICLCTAVADMIQKGVIGKDEKVAFNIKIDPSIGGGVVYNLGDTIVDCSHSTLENEFYASLSAAGIQRVE